MSEETEWVLVECASTFKIKYMVEVPKDKSEWALDTVVMQEAKEFSQEFIDESIFTHRVVSKKEALILCDKDNDYAKAWTKDKKVEVFFTTWKEQDGK